VVLGCAAACLSRGARIGPDAGSSALGDAPAERGGRRGAAQPMVRCARAAARDQDARGDRCAASADRGDVRSCRASCDTSCSTRRAKGSLWTRSSRCGRRIGTSWARSSIHGSMPSDSRERSPCRSSAFASGGMHTSAEIPPCTSTARRPRCRRSRAPLLGSLCRRSSSQRPRPVAPRSRRSAARARLACCWCSSQVSRAGEARRSSQISAGARPARSGAYASSRAPGSSSPAACASAIPGCFREADIRALSPR
jgi:hypothetical protein